MCCEKCAQPRGSRGHYTKFGLESSTILKSYGGATPPPAPPLRSIQPPPKMNASSYVLARLQKQVYNYPRWSIQSRAGRRVLTRCLHYYTARQLMGLNLVEIQQTDRYAVFGAPATPCKVHWPTKQVKASSASGGRVSGAKVRSVPISTRPAEMASDGSAASAVSVGASRKVLPEDVLLVAVHGARVDLHPASLDKACPVSCKPPRGGDAAFEVRCELAAVVCERRQEAHLLLCPSL